MVVNKAGLGAILAGLAFLNISSHADAQDNRTSNARSDEIRSASPIDGAGPDTALPTAKQPGEIGMSSREPSGHAMSIEREMEALSKTPRTQDAGAAAPSAEELAKKLSNPVAAMISVPFQFNYDDNMGPNDDGSRAALNLQPVIPFSLNAEWNLISRTILPVVFDQSDVVPGGGDQDGIGDILQSLFFSPKAPTPKGVIWGVGPVFSIPTASDDLLGSEKWGIGPTALALKQTGPWTYGALFNHVWSFAGDDNRADVNSTFLQPFCSHTTPTAWTYALNSESTYDWEADEWSIPLNFVVSKLTKLGGIPVSIGAGLRYWVDSAPNGPEGWGLRLLITPLFPK